MGDASSGERWPEIARDCPRLPSFGGSGYHTIKNPEPTLDSTLWGYGTRWERLGRRVLLDTAKGLLYLHGRGLVHFDVKPLNILVSARTLSPHISRISPISPHISQPLDVLVSHS